MIDAIYVKIGQKVSKGQILAKMNDAAYVEQIKGLKTNLELATTMYERQKVYGIRTSVQRFSIYRQKVPRKHSNRNLQLLNVSSK